MHTNDVLTGPRLCACADSETHFRNQHSNGMARQGQASLPESTCACERVTFSDPYASGARWGTPRVTALEAKM